MDEKLLDDIIRRLLEVRGKPGKQVQLSEAEIKQLCLVSKDIFLQQPNLLELEAPIKICGMNVLPFSSFSLKSLIIFFLSHFLIFFSLLFSILLLFVYLSIGLTFFFWLSLGLFGL